jgi:hypothetical protein
MNNEDKQPWMSYYNEGMQFYNAASKPGKRKIFTPLITYNIVCMAIEKLFMAFFFYNNRMPDNHTIKDLLESAARIRGIDRDFEENMLFLDGFQDICPVNAPISDGPGEKDMERVIKTLLMAKEFVDSALKIKS